MNRHISEKLRQIVAERAGCRCEYCKIHEEDSFFSFQVDHIISLKHGGTTTPDNLAWSCYPCNNAKSSDVGTVILPDKTFIRLFNPREDEWLVHFEYESGVVYAKTHIGTATIKVLKINDIDRIVERNLLSFDYP